MADPVDREAQTWRALFDDAQRRSRLHAGISSLPRFVTAAAEAMERHIEYGGGAASDRAALNFWSVCLSAAFAANPILFEAPVDYLPLSAQQLRAALEAHAALPQLVVVVFHVAGFPLIARMLGDAQQSIAGRPGHILMRRRNLMSYEARLRLPLQQSGHAIAPNRPGLRQLVTGLRDGHINRLLLLPDGPARPGEPGTFIAPAIGPMMAFRSGALSLCLRHRLPILPIVHYFEGTRLVIEPCALVQPTPHARSTMALAFMGEVFAGLALVLRHNPAQWLNWMAAAVRLRPDASPGGIDNVVGHLTLGRVRHATRPHSRQKDS